jgi:hypothetical protein
VAPADETDRLQHLHLALEGAVEQLTRALEVATRGTSIGDPPAEAEELERLLGALSGMRNQTRDRLMKLLAKPSLRVLK